MFQDNTALTWMLVILNVIFFISAFAGLLFASIASLDMLAAKHAKKDAEKLFEEANARQVRSIRESKNDLSNRTFLQ